MELRLVGIDLEKRVVALVVDLDQFGNEAGLGREHKLEDVAQLFCKGGLHNLGEVGFLMHVHANHLPNGPKELPGICIGGVFALFQKLLETADGKRDHLLAINK